MKSLVSFGLLESGEGILGTCVNKDVLSELSLDSELSYLEIIGKSNTNSKESELELLSLDSMSYAGTIGKSNTKSVESELELELLSFFGNCKFPNKAVDSVVLFSEVESGEVSPNK